MTQRNPTWLRDYSKTEIAQLMSKKDKKLDAAIYALRQILNECHDPEGVNTQRIEALARLTLNKLVD